MKEYLIPYFSLPADSLLLGIEEQDNDKSYPII